MNLENFNDFHTFIAANYNALNESTEEKFVITNDINAPDLIVYDEEEVEKETIHQEMIKVEIINDSEYIETEWIEEEKDHIKTSPKRAKRVPSLPVPRVSRQPVATVLDSADDQRIREIARMFCDVCAMTLDSLREAKAHYKLAHGIEGYIVCCER